MTDALEFQRLSVNINDESAAILRQVMATRNISATEAVRRAIGLLGFFENAKALQEAAAENDEADAEQARRAEEWESLTPEERQREIQSMDEHVAFWSERGGETP